MKETLTLAAALLAVYLPAHAGDSTEAETAQAVEQFERGISPWIEAQGKSLQVNLLWNSEIEQVPGGGAAGSATSWEAGGVVTLTLAGGLVRHPIATLDMAIFALCHELGHIGGPKYLGEMDADAFAVGTCLPSVWGGTGLGRRIKEASIATARYRYAFVTAGGHWPYPEPSWERSSNDAPGDRLQCNLDIAKSLILGLARPGCWK